jgi:hypothetical protein
LRRIAGRPGVDAGSAYTTGIFFGFTRFGGAEMGRRIAYLLGAAAIGTPLALALTPVSALAGNTANGGGSVTVVNTSANPVPVTGSVSASQSGTWNVGITGTPTVNVANGPATQNVAGTVGLDPANNTVREANSLASRPIYLNGTSSFGFNSDECDATVDLGTASHTARVVVTNLSVDITVPTGDKATAIFNAITNFGGTQEFHYLPVTDQGVFFGNQKLIAYGSAPFAVDPGADLQVEVTRSDCSGSGLNGSVGVELDGYAAS